MPCDVLSGEKRSGRGVWGGFVWLFGGFILNLRTAEC